MPVTRPLIARRAIMKAFRQRKPRSESRFGAFSFMIEVLSFLLQGAWRLIYKTLTGAYQRKGPLCMITFFKRSVERLSFV